jgi:hypothetical protein
MKNTQRLSIADFKLLKIDSKNEIDKLLGGTAGDCHPTRHEAEPGSGVYSHDIEGTVGN